MAWSIDVVSPIDGRVVLQRQLADGAEIDAALDRAQAAHRQWRQLSVQERSAQCLRFADALWSERDKLAVELAEEMGRPIRYGPLELKTTGQRANRMLELAEIGLQSHTPPVLDGFVRRIDRVPLGVVLVIPAWNYPYLVAINVVIPALVAGNAVIIKPSEQTPRAGERLVEALHRSGIPTDLVQVLHTTHHDTARLVDDRRVNAVSFVGSVSGGRAISRAASERFIPVGLELGGNDAAYVRADADAKKTAQALVDGAMFNSGQSCCAVERALVHADVYDDFVAAAVEEVYSYRIGDPRKSETTLGPVVREDAARRIRGVVADAVAQGARKLVEESRFGDVPDNGAYVAPQVVVDVTSEMALYRDETFGPVLPIVKVDDDDQAVSLINDSAFGLTASIWTRDSERGAALCQKLDVGTAFVNRCDYLDPDLAWTGTKFSGRGCSLSYLGYHAVTRPRSIHIRTEH